MLVGERVVFALVPDVAANSAVDSREEALSIHEFTPFLQIGDFKPEIQKSFGLRGSVWPYEESSMAAEVGAQIAAGFEAIAAQLALATATGQVQAAEERQSGANTWIGGVWIDYTFTAPGADASGTNEQSFRRDILEATRVSRWDADGEAAWDTDPMVYRDLVTLAGRLRYTADIIAPSGTGTDKYLAYTKIAAFTLNV